MKSGCRRKSSIGNHSVLKLPVLYDNRVLIANLRVGLSFEALMSTRYTPSTQLHLSISISVPQFKSVCREEPRARCSDHVTQHCSMDCSPVYWCRVCSDQDQQHNNIFY